MSDEIKAVVENEAEKTDQTNSPQVKEPATEVQTPAQEESKLPEGTTQSELPESTEEQRRAFQAMRQELKQLKEETAARKKNESAFSVFRPNQVQQPSGVDINQFTDPITGDVNLGAYNAKVNAALQQATSVAYQAQQSVDERLDEYQARNKHPELFADPDVEEEIASRYLFSKMKGENVTVSDVAERVAKRFKQAVSRAEKEGAEKVLEQVSPKEQAALSASAQTSNPARSAQSDEEFEQLRQQSRGRGIESNEAVAARLKAIPWANK